MGAPVSRVVRLARRVAPARLGSTMGHAHRRGVDPVRHAIFSRVHVAAALPGAAEHGAADLLGADGQEVVDVGAILGRVRDAQSHEQDRESGKSHGSR